MSRVALFVAPFFLETTVRFIDAVAGLTGVRLGLVSQDPVDRLPPRVRALVDAHYRIDDGLDAAKIATAARFIAGELGTIDTVIGTLEELQVPLAEVRRELDIAGMRVETAKNFRDKERMKQVLAAADLPCARYRLVDRDDSLRQFVEEIGFPVVVKPKEGAGARGTFRIDDAGRLDEYLAAIPPTAGRPVLVEEFIVGEEHSFDSVAVGGELVWHSINHYSPSPLHVLENPWIQWCVLLPREVDDPRYDGIRAVAGKALQALGMDTGLSHMEWFRRSDGSVAISEVGARPPGAQFTTLLSYAHDRDFYQTWARLVTFGQFSPPGRPYAAGAAYLRGQGKGRVKAIHGLDLAHKELGDLVVEARLPRIGAPASGGYEGEGYVILRHPETAVVEEGLERIISLVRVELHV